MQGFPPPAPQDDQYGQPAPGWPRRRPPLAQPLDDQDEVDANIPEPVRVRYRGSGSDPTFGLLVGFAVSIGLIPIAPEYGDVRYVAGWSALAVFAVLGWLLGETERIGKERVDNLVWGVVLGLILAVPMMLVGGSTLATTVNLLFRSSIDGVMRGLPAGAVFGLLVFTMPLAETLFFRGLVQYQRAFWIVGLIASAWSLLLFFPMLEVTRFPAVGLIIGGALVMMNMTYSYVRQRNGLAAAWLCQVTINVVLLFIPYVLS
ncbi:MAG: hypothetical protein SNJ59_16170 [Aggregatilineales bacterium]